MFGKQSFVALILASFAVAANTTSYDDPAPKPTYFPILADLTDLTLPSKKDLGSFVSNVASAGFALADDTGDLVLKAWIAASDWTSIDSTVKPVGGFLAGTVELD